LGVERSVSVHLELSTLIQGTTGVGGEERESQREREREGNEALKSTTEIDIVI
jgi:hypothetical protein